MQRIAECPRKLTHFVEHKSFEFHPLFRPDACLFFLLSLCCDHGLHILECIFPVKNYPLQRKTPEHFYHLAVHFPCLSAEMDLAGNPPVFQINRKCRICKDIASKSQFHALFYNIPDLRILFWKIIQRIEGEMYRLFIFFHHMGKDLQLTVCAKLHIVAENFSAV